MRKEQFWCSVVNQFPNFNAWEDRSKKFKDKDRQQWKLEWWKSGLGSQKKSNGFFSVGRVRPDRNGNGSRKYFRYIEVHCFNPILFYVKMSSIWSVTLTKKHGSLRGDVLMWHPILIVKIALFKPQESCDFINIKVWCGELSWNR